MEVTVASLPSEINVTADVTLSSFMIYLNFWLCYFDPVASLITASVALIPTFVKRAVFFHEPALGLTVNYISVLLWQCMNLWFIHLIVTKVGMLYIDAEVLREGNNETLDNLEEGIIILK